MSMVRFLVSANQQDILFATFALIEGQTYLLVKVIQIVSQASCTHTIKVVDCLSEVVLSALFYRVKSVVTCTDQVSFIPKKTSPDWSKMKRNIS